MADEIGLGARAQPNGLVLPKRGTRGAAAVEYGLLLLAIAVLAGALTHSVGLGLSGIFALAATSL